LSGIVLALVAGAVTSGLAYALWYSVMPHLPTTIAAVAQLSTPILAVGDGVVFLAKPLTCACGWPACLCWAELPW
jgi:drug/metabolite transporter (DMT)-like permease